MRTGWGEEAEVSKHWQSGALAAPSTIPSGPQSGCSGTWGDDRMGWSFQYGMPGPFIQEHLGIESRDDTSHLQGFLIIRALVGIEQEKDLGI